MSIFVVALRSVEWCNYANSSKGFACKHVARSEVDRPRRLFVSARAFNAPGVFRDRGPACEAAHAIVLSLDEKSQIQALDRTQPGLPMKKGRAGTMTHDYKRNGTTTLFAALDVLEGKVIGRCMQRHRHQEFIRFLKAIDAEVPAGKSVHVILDNYATHKHPAVFAWLTRHKRFTFHFTPTSCSWLNAVEGYFAKLFKQRLKRGVFRSVAELRSAIKRFIEETNQMPKPFVWTADPNKIIAAVRRGHQMLDSIPWFMQGHLFDHAPTTGGGPWVRERMVSQRTGIDNFVIFTEPNPGCRRASEKWENEAREPDRGCFLPLELENRWIEFGARQKRQQDRARTGEKLYPDVIGVEHSRANDGTDY
jgi:transposase